MRVNEWKKVDKYIFILLPAAAEQNSFSSLKKKKKTKKGTFYLPFKSEHEVSPARDEATLLLNRPILTLKKTIFPLQFDFECCFPLRPRIAVHFPSTCANR